MEVQHLITRYCNYQERSHQEVRNKLYELGCRPAEVEQQIAGLIESGILNEERYARAYARGKFRMNQWGRRKIIRGLKLQRVSEWCIRKALTEIDPEEYEQTLVKIAGKKWALLSSEKSPGHRRGKLFRFLLQKGFEQDMINEVYQQITAAD